MKLTMGIYTWSCWMPISCQKTCATICSLHLIILFSLLHVKVCDHLHPKILVFNAFSNKVWISWLLIIWISACIANLHTWNWEECILHKMCLEHSPDPTLIALYLNYLLLAPDFIMPIEIFLPPNIFGSKGIF